MSNDVLARVGNGFLAGLLVCGGVVVAAGAVLAVAAIGSVLVTEVLGIG